MKTSFTAGVTLGVVMFAKIVQHRLAFVVVRPIQKCSFRALTVAHQTLRMGRDLEDLETKIFQASGKSFNLNSPKQTAEILYDVLGLPVSGDQRSTAVPALKALERDGHEVPGLILRWRNEAKKINSKDPSKRGSIEQPPTASECVRFDRSKLQAKPPHAHDDKPEPSLNMVEFTEDCPGKDCKEFQNCEEGQMISDRRWIEDQQAKQSTKQSVNTEVSSEAGIHPVHDEKADSLIDEDCPGFNCDKFSNCEEGQVVIEKELQHEKVTSELGASAKQEAGPALSSSSPNMEEETDRFKQEWAAMQWDGKSAINLGPSIEASGPAASTNCPGVDCKDFIQCEQGQVLAEKDVLGGEQVPAQGVVEHHTPCDELYVVDGTYLLFRSFFAMPPLTNSKGVPVGALVGFCNQLNKLTFAKHQKGHSFKIFVVFDAKSSGAARKQLYPAYKGNRGPPPDALVPQFALAREACAAWGVPVLQPAPDAAGFGAEADDVLATAATAAAASGAYRRVLVVSGDKDLAALVDPAHGVALYDLYKDQALASEEDVVAKYGVRPAQIGDFLALTGDASDNVPGVPGVGPKTAARLLGEHGTLEAVLARAPGGLKPGAKLRQNLEEHAAAARLARELVALRLDVPLELAGGGGRPGAAPAHAPVGAGGEAALAFCRAHELLDLAARVEAMVARIAAAGGGGSAGE